MLFYGFWDGLGDGCGTSGRRKRGLPGPPATQLWPARYCEMSLGKGSWTVLSSSKRTIRTSRASIQAFFGLDCSRLFLGLKPPLTLCGLESKDPGLVAEALEPQQGEKPRGYDSTDFLRKKNTKDLPVQDQVPQTPAEFLPKLNTCQRIICLKSRPHHS